MNIWSVETDFIARWAAQVPRMLVVGTLDQIDWTANESPCVAGQVVFNGLVPGDEVRGTVKVSPQYSAHVFLDAVRCVAADKAKAAQAIEAALKCVTGWEVTPGFFAKVAPGQVTGFDGRLIRVSVSFFVPAVAVGLV